MQKMETAFLYPVYNSLSEEYESLKAPFKKIFYDYSAVSGQYKSLLKNFENIFTEYNLKPYDCLKTNYDEVLKSYKVLGT